RPPSSRADRPGLEGELGRLGGGSLGGVAPGQYEALHTGSDQIGTPVGIEIGDEKTRAGLRRQPLDLRFMELAEPIVEDRDGRRTIRREDQIQVAVALDVEYGQARMGPLAPTQRRYSRPGRQRGRQPALGSEVLPGDRDRCPGRLGAARDRLRAAVVA